MSIKYIYGIRTVSAVSLLSAIMMMFMSTYVFVVRIEDLLSSKFPDSDVPLNISSTEDGNQTENSDYEMLLNNINTIWIQYRSVLVSSSMLATLAGLLQCIFSGLVLLADAKSARLYTRKWVTVHFMLVLVLFIILFNTAVLSENEDRSEWESLLHRLNYYLKKVRPRTDYSELFTFLGVNQFFIYVGVGIDLAIILIMIGMMFYMFKYLEEYEPCE